MEDTKVYNSDDIQKEYISKVIKDVSSILEDRGYNPVNQIVGYLISGNPGYISSYKEARNKITEFDRAKILETIIREFLENK